MRSTAAAIRSCATRSSTRSRPPAASAPDSGWIPAHLVVRDAATGRLVAAVPQYLKTHSWGEFVFDWSWAQSYQRAGLEYYPKQLVGDPVHAGDRPAPAAATPITPTRRACVTSWRACCSTLGAAHAGVGRARQFHARRRPGRARAGRLPAPPRLPLPLAQPRLPQLRRLPRDASAPTSARRRSASGARWRRPASCSARSPARTSTPTLWRVDLRLLRAHVPAARQRALPQRRVPAACRAARCPARSSSSSPSARARPIAAAIFFQGGGGLYGRYWGAAAAEDSLHFEACYYQGIEHCIEQRPAVLRPRHAGRAQARARLRADAHDLGALARARRASARPSARYLERERAGGRRLHRGRAPAPALPARRHRTRGADT